MSIYKGHIEVIFDVVHSFFDDKITHKLHITVEKEKIISSNLA